MQAAISLFSIPNSSKDYCFKKTTWLDCMRDKVVGQKMQYTKVRMLLVRISKLISKENECEK